MVTPGCWSVVEDLQHTRLAMHPSNSLLTTSGRASRTTPVPAASLNPEPTCALLFHCAVVRNTLVKPGARGNRVRPGLISQQAVQALDVQGQTHQIPLALDRVQAAHPELAKAQDALNPADGCFHQPFALGISLLTLGRVQFVRHALGGRSRGAPP